LQLDSATLKTMMTCVSKRVSSVKQQETAPPSHSSSHQLANVRLSGAYL